MRGSGLGRAGELAKWTLLFVLVNQLAYIVIVNLGNSAGAAAAEAGITYGVGYTPYATAYLIFILPHSIITVSVMTGLLPRMSREAADGDLAAVRRSLSEAWRLTGVGVILCAAALVALAPQLAGVLYAGADGAPASAYYIGLVAAAFALGLPAFSAQYIALRGFYAFEDTRTPFYLQIAIAGDERRAGRWPLYAALPLRWRMVGVAFAYSLTYIGGLALSTSVLRRRTGGPRRDRGGPALRAAAGRRRTLGRAGLAGRLADRRGGRARPARLADRARGRRLACSSWGTSGPPGSCTSTS